MVTLEIPKAKIGKFTLDVKPSADNASCRTHRSDALAAWLLSQWTKQQVERN